MKAAVCGMMLGFFLVVGAAHATPAAVRAGDPDIVNSEDFIRAHPDLRFRRSGMDAYGRERFKEAFEHFKDAARYADKTSQAMIAEMLWKGEGVTQDRPLAYAWMDLAAERNYPPLIVLRERYWSALNASERARAVDVGQAIYDEFGDKVAKPRTEKELARARINVTGSRVGRVGTLAIPGSMDVPRERPGQPTVVTEGSLGNVVDGTRYYAAEYWDPKQYWKWQDAQWQRLGEGSVIVGAPQGVGKMN